MDFINISINLPDLKKPKPATRNLELSKKNYCTIKDLCKVLKPDTFRYRLRAGYYPEPAKTDQEWGQGMDVILLDSFLDI